LKQKHSSIIKIKDILAEYMHRLLFLRKKQTDLLKGYQEAITKEQIKDLREKHNFHGPT